MSIADDYASIGRAIRERATTPPAPETATPDERPYCAWCHNTRKRTAAMPNGIAEVPCDKCAP